jgi:hypothetical protein
MGTAPHPQPFSPRSGEKGERSAEERVPSPVEPGEGVGSEGISRDGRLRANIAAECQQLRESKHLDLFFTYR